MGSGLFVPCQKGVLMSRADPSREQRLLRASLTTVVLGVALSGCTGQNLGDSDGAAPMTAVDGLTSDGSVDRATTERSVPASYWPGGVDQGTANPGDRFRALMILPMRNVDALVQLVQTLYDPSSAQFRHYLTA